MSLTQLKPKKKKYILPKGTILSNGTVEEYLVRTLIEKKHWKDGKRYGDIKLKKSLTIKLKVR